MTATKLGIICATVVLVVLTLATAYFHTRTTTAAFAAGYCAGTLPGHQGEEWVKCPLTR